MGYHDQSVALLVFFPVFTTITVGIRIFVRTRLIKGAFGWDDVLLIITNVTSFSLSPFNNHRQNCSVEQLVAGLIHGSTPMLTTCYKRSA